MRMAFGAAAMLLACCGGALGQVVISEVSVNPPAGLTDEEFAYIELYGCPNLDLTGYMVAVVKGGRDPDGDDVIGQPGFVDTNRDIPEVDEAFALDGWSLDENGYFVIAFTDFPNNLTTQNPLRPNPAFTGPLVGENPLNKRFLNGATAFALHIVSGDEVGQIATAGSTNILLIRRRPNDTRVSPLNQRPDYLAGHAWEKDTLVDVNFDSEIDRGGETSVPQIPGQPAGNPNLEPYQLVDELAWSDDGGKEYMRDSDNEISDTPAFNPDSATRIRYYLDNPMLGFRTVDDPMAMGGFRIEPTRTADEAFVYGEVDAGPIPNPVSGGTITGQVYTSDLEAAPGDMNRPLTKAPTDQTALGYDGSCDPEPDDGDLPLPPTCTPTPSGMFLIDDIDAGGLPMTPGFENSGAGITQFQFIPGDLDFDMDVDADDLTIAQNLLGATLDDQVVGTFGMEWRWQGPAFQQVLALLKLVDDGEAVTQADIDVIADQVEPVNVCVFDFNNDGSIDGADFGAFGAAFGSMAGDMNYAAQADSNNDGVVDGADFGSFGAEFGRTDCLQ